MNFSVGVEYSIHCLLHMMEVEEGRSIGVKSLAEFQNLSETYLSKMFTKLVKAEIIKSAPGVKGGYIFAREPENISFWDVIEAIEGKEHFFYCREIRQNEILLDKNNLPDVYTKTPCLIMSVIWEGEEKMKEYLKTKNIQWLYDQTKKKIPGDVIVSKKEWFKNK